MPIRSRAYEGEADVRLMQRLQQELWPIEGERTHAHVGDLAWMTTHAPREEEWNRRLWLDGERCVAWAWIERGASLDYELHSEYRGGPLHDEVLDWFESEAPRGTALSVWWMENDDVSLPLLSRRGYEWSEDGGSYPSESWCRTSPTASACGL
jgi:hypothetical protein